MRAVIQRVSQSVVKIDEETVGRIDRGLAIFLGVAHGDTKKDAEYLAKKIVNLRIFEDSGGKMNLSLYEIGGDALIISQFTLLADCRKGRRPSFVKAAHPDMANKLYTYFISQIRSLGIMVQTGRFGAMMGVSLTNEGPVTLIIDSMLD